MNEHTLLRLLLRVAGVVVIAFALPELFNTAGWLIDEISNRNMFGPARSNALSRGVYALAPLVQLAFGIYLVAGGRAIRERFAYQISDRCHSCGYPWEGLEVTVCPECGTPREKHNGQAHAEPPSPGPGNGPRSTSADSAQAPPAPPAD